MLARKRNWDADRPLGLGVWELVEMGARWPDWLPGKKKGESAAAGRLGDATNCKVSGRCGSKDAIGWGYWSVGLIRGWSRRWGMELCCLFAIARCFLLVYWYIYFCEGLLGVTGGYEGWIWVWTDLGEGVFQESIWVLALVPWLDEDMRICGRGTWKTSTEIIIMRRCIKINSTSKNIPNHRATRRSSVDPPCIAARSCSSAVRLPGGCISDTLGLSGAW